MSKIICHYCEKDITDEPVCYYRNLKDNDISLLVCKDCYEKEKQEG